MLSERLQKMYDQTRSGYYRKYRTQEYPVKEIEEQCKERPAESAMAERFRIVLEAERPVIIPGEIFFFTRTLEAKPSFFPDGRQVKNLTAEWEILLQQGVFGRIRAAQKKLQEHGLSPNQQSFLENAIRMMESVLDLSERYAKAAELQGDSAGAALLKRVPAYPAETLKEAIQAVFFLFSMFHHSGVTLQGLGRMDQYLEPFYLHDLSAGILTPDQAKEMLEEFFLMLNRENDLYGMEQPGDDGESVMLGGCRRDGSSGYNSLTLLILEAAYETSMINPKINLRVNADTPEEVLKAGIRLTGKGLGFPQYCNDEVIIPALVKFGYPLEDARDYTVAACWEFVIKHGMDIPNTCWINLALAADHAIRKALKNDWSFDRLLEELYPELHDQVHALGKFSFQNYCPNPLFSSFFGECIERGLDIQKGGADRYHLGMLSAGSATAADSLAAVKKFVYDEKTVSPERLLKALETNYAEDAELCKLMKTGPKTGMNDPETNRLLKKLFDVFCDCTEEIKDNGTGGRIRPGTGSAQGYVVLTQNKQHPRYLKATANGRKEGEFIESSLAPAPGTRSRGIFSILKTYGNLDFSRLCNGGPITMEFAPSYFRNAESVERTSGFIRSFVRSGCQQCQMNVLDHAKLRDAQIHPERYRDLIVRVWGWSGYFVELDKSFQDQIIGRQAYEG